MPRVAFQTRPQQTKAPPWFHIHTHIWPLGEGYLATEWGIHFSTY